MEISVPGIRMASANDAPIREQGDFVLYWMSAFRRAQWNFSLDRAVGLARDLGKPLVILEALRCDYPWASDRLHRFIMEGMADNARAFESRPVLYYPYLEPHKGAGKGLLEAVAQRACAVVTDHFPAFFIPRMVRTAAERLPVRLETVDSNGLLPMRAADRVYPTAYAFRRFLQKSLPPYLLEQPRSDPFKGIQLKRIQTLPKDILKRWPPADGSLLNKGSLEAFPIDHQVVPTPTQGGTRAGRARLKHFLAEGLSGYPEDRNQPEKDGTSRLSPYLHFGHLSVHEVFDAVMKRERWFLDRLSLRASGSKTGWWGMSAEAEAFLDELITWRELGFNMCLGREDYERYESLPEWALKTLKSHEKDKRAYLYDLETFAVAKTHDPLWNAAQGELLREGRIHNYLRMLWGKKILEWTPSPREALRIMIELNNRYALDGRDPNSYSGIFWVLGRYDRPWAPDREVFGTVRYMSSKNTARKVKVGEYIKRYYPKIKNSKAGIGVWRDRSS